MTFKVKHNGVWKDGVPSVNDGGTWKTPSEIYVKNNGVWETIWTDTFEHTITANQSDFDLHTYLTNAGWNGISNVEVTIDTGVYIWSTSTLVPALDTGGSYPYGLTIINKGFIMGKGGDGGWWQPDATDPMNNPSTAINPTAGGPAIKLTAPVSIDNSQGYIGGGGGGGAPGGINASIITLYTGKPFRCSGGGGAGGGEGGKAFSLKQDVNPGATLSAMAAGGAIGQAAPASLYLRQTVSGTPITTAPATTILGVNYGAGGSSGLAHS